MLPSRLNVLVRMALDDHDPRGALTYLMWYEGYTAIAKLLGYDDLRINDKCPRYRRDAYVMSNPAPDVVMYLEWCVIKAPGCMFGITLIDNDNCGERNWYCTLPMTETSANTAKDFLAQSVADEIASLPRYRGKNQWIPL